MKSLNHKGACENEDVRAFEQLLTCNVSTLKVLVVVVSICF